MADERTAELDAAFGTDEPTDEQRASDLRHYDVADLRKGARAIAEARRVARRVFTEAAFQEADAEAEYRRMMASRFNYYRTDQGLPVQAAEINARGDEAVRKAKRERMEASARAVSAKLRIEELERNAATMRQVADWSQKIGNPGTG